MTWKRIYPGDVEKFPKDKHIVVAKIIGEEYPSYIDGIKWFNDEEFWEYRPESNCGVQFLSNERVYEAFTHYCIVDFEVSDHHGDCVTWCSDGTERFGMMRCSDVCIVKKEAK